MCGLGRGIDASGRLADDAIARALDALAGFRPIIDRAERVQIVATSASRDATNRESFFDQVEAVTGHRPELISGEAEAGFAFTGATSWRDRSTSACVVDIGGGSTEFVFGFDRPGYAISVDMGSVRLTDRLLLERPVTQVDLEEARSQVREAFATVSLPAEPATVIGVAGSCTSVAAMCSGLEHYDRARVHGAQVSAGDVDALVERLASMSLSETERIPALEPARAPVILGGALVLAGVFDTLGIEQMIVSERDLLHGVAAALLAQST